MNFLLKAILLIASPIYIYATCTLPATNASNSLRLAHNVCPKLFVPHPDKEKSIITFYQNRHNLGTNKGEAISITINLNRTYSQAWINTLPVTVGYLRDQINADGEFKALASGARLTIEALEAGYKVDAVATGNTPVVGVYDSTTREGNLTSAEVNVTATTTLKYGADAIAEQVTWTIKHSTTGIAEDINFSNGIRKVQLFVNGASTNTTEATVAYSGVTHTLASLSTRLKVLVNDPAIGTIDGTGDTITATSARAGVITTMQITLEHNTSGTANGNTGWQKTTLGPGKGTREVTQKGVNAIASVRRIYYYGNEGNYSIKFWPNDIGNNSNTSIYTIETPFIRTTATSTLANTLNYLDKIIDANGTYTSVPTSLANNHGYLTLTSRTAGAKDFNLSGKSGNGIANLESKVQGKATPIDTNMTYMSYNDNFLYTTFDIKYDVNETDGNYSSAKQDILEIFEVTHIHNADNSAANTIDLTSAVVLRHDDNVSSVVSVNDIVFLGDDNSSYYKFDRRSANGKLTNMEQLKEPNEISNVHSNMTEHYQDGDDGYVFIADDTRMRVYKVDRSNKVTHYVTHSNFGGMISDMIRDGQYLYVQSNEGDRLTKFIIVSENNRFSIERAKTFTLDAEKVYVRGKFIYYTEGTVTTGTAKHQGYRAIIGNTIIEDKEVVNDNTVSFMVGDEFYSASIGLDGLKIYDYNKTINSADGAYSGSRILILGEFIITDDLNSSQIRVYKFGDVSVSAREGEGSPAKPFNLKMMTNKININDINWSVWKNGAGGSTRLRQRTPSYPFIEEGLWFVEATITYNNYPFTSRYRYRINIIEDNAPGVEINASHMRGLEGLKVDFTSIITKDSYIDSIMWDFNDSNKSTFLPATSVMRNPSWTFEKQGDYNVTFMVYYDRDKNVTKNLMIHISSPLEINSTNVEGNNSTIHVKGDDVNFSASVSSNPDFYTIEEVGGVDTVILKPIKSYTWSFGDKDNTVSYLEEPIFAYNETGNVIATVEIVRVDEKGNDIKYIAKKTLSIVNFSEPTIIADKLSGETPLTVNFNVMLKSYLAKGIRPKSIAWTFTGGGVSAKQNPSFTFDTPAANGYVVTAKVKLSDGKTLDLEKTIMVSNDVNVSIEANALAGYSPLTVRLVATGTSFEGINSYEWEIGLKGQEKVKKTGTSLEHTFDSNGTYEVNVTAFSNKDHSGTDGLEIKVKKGPDVIIKSELIDPDDETNMKFTATTEDANVSLDKNTSWLINDIVMATDTETFTYKFLRSKAYKIEFKMLFKGGNIVKYVYARNPSFNPYVKKVKVYTGWNLISSPLDEVFKVVDTTNGLVPEQATDDIQRLRDISTVIWTFTGNTWRKDPASITNKVGFWIKANADKELIFDGNTKYKPDLTSLTSGNWYLVGTGEKLDKYKANNGALNVVWIYRKGKWYKNPDIINVGDGIWIKAN